MIDPGEQLCIWYVDEVVDGAGFLLPGGKMRQSSPVAMPLPAGSEVDRVDRSVSVSDLETETRGASTKHQEGSEATPPVGPVR